MAAAGGGIVGVRAAAGDTTTEVTTGVRRIAGPHGTLQSAGQRHLHLSVDGEHDHGGDDRRVRLHVKDGDGDLSTTTLTINLAQRDLYGDRHRRAGERGGAAGDRQRRGIETARSSTVRHGVRRHRSVHLCADQPGDRQPRHAAAERRDGTYTYTLTSPFDMTPDSATTAAQTEQDKESFSYTVTDAQGNSTTGTIRSTSSTTCRRRGVDSGKVNEGALLTVAASGVLANDVCRRGWLCGWRRGGRSPRGGRRHHDGGDHRRRGPTLPACTARCISMPTAPTPTSRRPTASRRMPPTCSSTRSRTATATCRRRR